MSMNGEGQQSGSSMLPMFIMLMLLMMIFFSPGLFGLIGTGIGYALNPVIGFGGKAPLLTILFAGMIMGLISTLIRHKFINWVDMARNQKVMSAFNKERRDALLSRNAAKLKKLTELQPEIMRRTMRASTSQLKPMMFTMIIIIMFFAWLNTFLNVDVPFTTFSVPWNHYVPLTGSLVFPYWIMIYFLVTLPMGMVFQRILKYYSFKKKLASMDEGPVFIEKYEEPEVPRKKRTTDLKRERARFSFICTICNKKVREGSWAHKCRCGKYYHERCTARVKKCPTCGTSFLEEA